MPDLEAVEPAAPPAAPPPPRRLELLPRVPVGVDAPGDLRFFDLNDVITAAAVAAAFDLAVATAAVAAGTAADELFLAPVAVFGFLDAGRDDIEEDDKARGGPPGLLGGLEELLVLDREPVVVAELLATLPLRVVTPLLAPETVRGADDFAPRVDTREVLPLNEEEPASAPARVPVPRPETRLFVTGRDDTDVVKEEALSRFDFRPPRTGVGSSLSAANATASPALPRPSREEDRALVLLALTLVVAKTVEDFPDLVLILNLTPTALTFAPALSLPSPPELLARFRLETRRVTGGLR